MRKSAIVEDNFVTSAHVRLCALAGLNCSVGLMFVLPIVLFTADHRCGFTEQKAAAFQSQFVTVKRCRERLPSVCMGLAFHPLAQSEPCPFEMFFVHCGASQMNGPWSSEVSSVDPGVMQTQWWPSFYRKNKNRDPRAHGPCCGRGLDMVGHFKGRKKGRMKWSYI